MAGSPNRGAALFTAGESSDVSSGVQDVDVSAVAALIEGRTEIGLNLGAKVPRSRVALVLIEGVFVLPDLVEKEMIGAADLRKRDGGLVAGLFARSVHVLFQERHTGILIRGNKVHKGDYVEGRRTCPGLLGAKPAARIRPDPAIPAAQATGQLIGHRRRAWRDVSALAAAVVSRAEVGERGR